MRSLVLPPHLLGGRRHGKLQSGRAGVIPDGNFARRLVLRFDV